MSRCGIIRPEPITGAFSYNLRRIVERYRRSVDSGAEVVFCTPFALSGTGVGSLGTFSGFRHQYQAALAYLCKEMTSVPLIMAEGLSVEGWVSPQLHRYHLQDGRLTYQCQVGENGDCSYQLDDDTQISLHYHTAPWHMGGGDCALQEQMAALSKDSHHPVLLLRASGFNGDCFWSGDCMISHPNGGFTELPGLFAQGACLWDTQEGHATHRVEQHTLCDILHSAMAQFIAYSHAQGIYLGAHKGPLASFLIELLAETAPTLPVECIDVSDISSLYNYREECVETGYKLILPLSKSEIALDSGACLRALAADWLPVGDVYASSAEQQGIRASEPTDAVADHILHSILTERISPTELCTLCPAQELLIRRIQRQLHSTEPLRRRLTNMLHLSEEPPAGGMPLLHQLRD